VLAAGALIALLVPRKAKEPYAEAEPATAELVTA
jgi:hypothetical protein